MATAPPLPPRLPPRGRISPIPEERKDHRTDLPSSKDISHHAEPSSAYYQNNRTIEFNRLHSTSLSSPDEQTSPMSSFNNKSPLDSEIYYWQGCNKEYINECMRDQPDGAFLIRDNSDRGNYTLTLRKDGANKLIKIVHNANRNTYGFSVSDTMQFRTVPALVTYYRENTLRRYNDCLDISLSKPMPRPAATGGMNNKQETLDCLINELKSTQKRLVESKQLYDQIQLAIKQCDEETALQTRNTNGLETLKNLLLEQSNLYEANKNEGFMFYADDGSKLEPKRPVKVSVIEQRKWNDGGSALSLMLIESGHGLNHANQEQFDQNQKNSNLNASLMSTARDWIKDHRRRLHIFELLRLKGISSAERERILKEINTSLEKNELDSSDLFPPLDLDEISLNINSLKIDHVDCIKAESTWFTRTRSRDECRQWLRVFSAKDGTFLIRPSTSMRNAYALDIVCNNEVQSCLIENKSEQFGFKDTEVLFASLSDFVQHYACNSLVEHNAQFNTTLKYPAFSIGQICPRQDCVFKGMISDNEDSDDD